MSGIAIAALAAACLMAGGCDFLRKVAGRPTSAQIEAEVSHRAELEQQRLEAERDSISRVQEEAEAAAIEVEEKEAESTETAAVAAPRMHGRYYVVVGSYREPRHAERKKKKMEAAGCKAVVTRVRGLNVVAVCPSATRDEANRTMNRLRRRGLCPQSAWILKLN